MDARTAQQAKSILQRAKKTMHSAALTWDIIASLRKATSMKIILKGIMAPEDARLAVKYGADAIVVSNHGGRQLDCVPSTLEVLPHIVKAVDGRLPVLFDGGVRRGSDVFKAIALGADLVLIGRPVVWGLGYKGQEGLETIVNIFGERVQPDDGVGWSFEDCGYQKCKFGNDGKWVWVFEAVICGGLE
jgi:(S)-2-hydroxy-acid oxidase